MNLDENNIYYAFVNSTSFNVVNGCNYTPFNVSINTVLKVSSPIINQGKKINIKVALKDVNGNVLKNKKISLVINGKTYISTTNNKGIAIFKIAGLKSGKHKFTVKFEGDNIYKSSIISEVQNVKAKVDLAIGSIKKLKSSNKQISRYKVIIANKGSLKSKTTILSLFHIKKLVKIKTKTLKIKSIGSGKKISLIVSYYPDKTYHKYCIAYFTLDPKNKNKEVVFNNNEKSISLKN